ncbi:MAG: zinc metallopeptidase [Clostridia bacterium]|nr:zinc metallopeptidase [Clostridia bacterium]
MIYGFDPTIILLIPAIIFTIYAQSKVKNAYAKYSRVPTRKGITGQQTARLILDNNNMGHVPIEVIPGQLTDNYDPTKDVMHLSNGIYNGNSIASVAVAAHESGHAIQDGTNYGFLKFRIAMVPVVNLVSGASWPLLIIGLIMVGAGQAFGNVIFDIGVLMFVVVVLFHTITLPVEFNASSRALKQLVALDIVDESEVKGCKRVLSAAAMTYVAALATSILNLIRILLIRGSNN